MADEVVASDFVWMAFTHTVDTDCLRISCKCNSDIYKDRAIAISLADEDTERHSWTKNLWNCQRIKNVEIILKLPTSILDRLFKQIN